MEITNKNKSIEKHFAFLGFQHVLSIYCKPNYANRIWAYRLRGAPGQFNAITDVKASKSVMRLCSGDKRAGGHAGVAQRFCLGKIPAGAFLRVSTLLTGNGEMTGEGRNPAVRTPILITSTHSVGVVRRD